MSLNASDVSRIGNAILSTLHDASVQEIRRAVAAAGMDAGSLPSENNCNAVMTKAYSLFRELPLDEMKLAIPILAEQVLRNPRTSGSADKITPLLRQHGFHFVDGHFLPIGLFDEREAKYLPASSANEISLAMERLVAGDLSGAITKACGAVDNAASELIEKQNLPTATSLPAKVNTVLNRLKTFEKMQQEITYLGLSPADAESAVCKLQEAIKRATDALAVLRRTMGDVHGTKPTNPQMVYSSVKLASAICGILEQPR